MSAVTVIFVCLLMAATSTALDDAQLKTSTQPGLQYTTIQDLHATLAKHTIPGDKASEKIQQSENESIDKNGQNNERQNIQGHYEEGQGNETDHNATGQTTTNINLETVSLPSTKRSDEITEVHFMQRLVSSTDHVTSLSANTITPAIRVTESKLIEIQSTETEKRAISERSRSTTPVAQPTTMLYKLLISKKPPLKSTIPSLPSNQTLSTKPEMSKSTVNVSTFPAITSALVTPVSKSAGSDDSHKGIEVTLARVHKSTLPSIITKPVKRNVTKPFEEPGGDLPMDFKTTKLVTIPVAKSSSMTNPLTPIPKPTIPNKSVSGSRGTSTVHPGDKIISDTVLSSTVSVVTSQSEPAIQTPQLEIPSQTPHSVKPSHTPQSDIISQPSQSVTTSLTPQSVKPSQMPQLELPSETPRSVKPSQTPQSDIVSQPPQSVIPSQTSQSLTSRETVRLPTIHSTTGSTLNQSGSDVTELVTSSTELSSSSTKLNSDVTGLSVINITTATQNLSATPSVVTPAVSQFPSVTARLKTETYSSTLLGQNNTTTATPHGDYVTSQPLEGNLSRDGITQSEDMIVSRDNTSQSKEEILSPDSTTAVDFVDYYYHHESEIHHGDKERKSTIITPLAESTVSMTSSQPPVIATHMTSSKRKLTTLPTEWPNRKSSMPSLTPTLSAITTLATDSGDEIARMPKSTFPATRNAGSERTPPVRIDDQNTTPSFAIFPDDILSTATFLWTNLIGRSTSPSDDASNDVTASLIPSTKPHTMPVPSTSKKHGVVPKSTVGNTPKPVTVKPKATPTRFTPKTKPNEINPNVHTLATRKPGNVGVTSPRLYIGLFVEMTKAEICKARFDLKATLASLVVKEVRSSDNGIDRNQVVLKPLDDTCSNRGWRKRRDTATERVDVYMVDSRGAYSYRLTNLLAIALQQKGTAVFTGSRLEGKVAEIRVYGDASTPKPDTLQVAIDNQSAGVNLGAIIGIIIGSLIVIAVMAFLALIVATRWRRRGIKKMRHVTASARPSLNLDLDCNSLAESIQMQAFNRRGSRRGSTRYGRANPSMDFHSDESELTSNLLNFEDLEQILKRPEIIEDEFLMLPNNLASLSDLPENTEDKNRYANVIPNPDTRVPLDLNVKDGATSYINANFIKGYQGYPKCYIATQAPLEATVYDFWRMVWEQNTSVIVMLTALTENNIEKCKEYWPNTEGGDTTRLYGEFRISQERRIVMPEWIQTTLQVKYKKAKQQKQIQHFWLTSWPHHGVPDYRTLIKFLVKIRPFMDDSAAPPVIHCSPGTGRTGVFIALDISMLSYEDSGMINVLNTVHEMRKDRGGMVQTKEQYAFIYKVLFEFAKMLNNPVSSARSSMSSTTSSFK